MIPIGIVGQGFVGNAIKEGFKNNFEVLTYDKYVDSKSNCTLEEMVEKCSIIFSCVPTPMDMKTGEASIHIVEEVVRNIDAIAKKLIITPTIIIKSTVPVGTTEFLDNTLAKNSNVLFSPEFLTEANAVEDFKNQNRIVLGVNQSAYDINTPEYIKNVKTAFNEIFMGKADIVITGAPIAEMTKYVTNTFLATKVSYANEIYQIAEENGVDYNEVIKIATLDKRLGDSHWMVPGPDGDFGFGGHCFPKDLHSLRFIARKSNLKTKVLDATIKTNDHVRSDRDWENQEGRAVINSNKRSGQGRNQSQLKNNYKILDITVKIGIILVAITIIKNLITC